MKPLHSLSLKYEGDKLWVLDQTLLPHEEVWIECKSPDHMVELIQRLAVRGAPLIGVAAALAIGDFASKGASIDSILTAAKKLRQARPTAVNLMAAMDYLIADPVLMPTSRHGDYHEKIARVCAIGDAPMVNTPSSPNVT